MVATEPIACSVRSPAATASLVMAAASPSRLVISWIEAVSCSVAADTVWALARACPAAAATAWALPVMPVADSAITSASRLIASVRRETWATATPASLSTRSAMACRAWR